MRGSGKDPQAAKRPAPNPDALATQTRGERGNGRRALERRKMTKTILLYGATGFTGKLIAREARARQASLVLAGRNPKTLKASRKSSTSTGGRSILRIGRGSTPR